MKEEEIAMELEREEVEKRRALPQEQRDKEDIEHATKLREAKPKGQQKFLQKYYHKGAFHQVRTCTMCSFPSFHLAIRTQKFFNDTTTLHRRNLQWTSLLCRK
jgi:hypothetical protein